MMVGGDTPLEAMLGEDEREATEEEVAAALDGDQGIDDQKSEASRHYAEIVAELRRAGTPLPTNDIWIAAVASRNGTTVLTCDDHFERIARIGSIVIDG
jgi:predicted nucleic acid-binding protein